MIRSLEDCWHPRNTEEGGSDQEQEHEPVQEEARDDEATIVPSPDFSPTGASDHDFADPLETSEELLAGLPVTAAAKLKLGERSLCNLIATCYVLGQE